ncbi:MAG TPA: class I SAM-dependent methyltransferase [Nitrospiria bacterium]|nr:class I SAM-dependent methyltransferase [Nitrospiria bacterium]
MPLNWNHKRSSAVLPGAAPTTCPLCTLTKFSTLKRIQSRIYNTCRECGLVFLSPEHRLGREEERSRYLLHENHPGDTAYRNFLNRLAVHLVPKLAPGSSGLDFGSGPGPTLSIMLEELGFSMTIYDPFFKPDTAVFKRQFDFVTCTETIEHFYHPEREFEKLDRLIKPGGWLGGMTGILDSDKKFGDWHYHREPTHVCFYKKTTMNWIADRFNWRAEFPGKDIVLFQKGPALKPETGGRFHPPVYQGAHTRND